MTTPQNLAEKASIYLNHLCLEIPNRRVGSPGNRVATHFYTNKITESGFEIDLQEFDCVDWTHGAILLETGSEYFQAQISPYSPGCKVTAPLVVAATMDELEIVDAQGKIILLRGELAKEQLMPKNFPFYNPEEHQRIFRLLEAGMPAAVIAATSRNPEMAGGLYPFPLIEDGDFNIPSAYMTDEVGERLAQLADQLLTLEIEAQRTPAIGYNPVARKAGLDRKSVVVSAHIDAKEGTPGAIDNASGVVVLLLLAELLADYQGSLAIELVAFNGEDHYSAAGEVTYLAHNQERLSDIALNINIDGVGYIKGNTAYSLYGCPQDITSLIEKVFHNYPEVVPGEQWYQGDHSIFIQKQVPAMAITSELALELTRNVTHTQVDTPELVDPHKLAHIAWALQQLLLELAQMLTRY